MYGSKVEPYFIFSCQKSFIFKTTSFHGILVMLNFSASSRFEQPQEIQTFNSKNQILGLLSTFFCLAFLLLHHFLSVTIHKWSNKKPFGNWWSFVKACERHVLNKKTGAESSFCSKTPGLIFAYIRGKNFHFSIQKKVPLTWQNRTRKGSFFVIVNKSVHLIWTSCYAWGWDGGEF